MPTNRALWPARRSTNSPAISLEIDLAHLNVARFFHESPLPPKQLGKGHIGVMIWNWYKAQKRQHFTSQIIGGWFFQMYFHDFSMICSHLPSFETCSSSTARTGHSAGQRRPYKLNSLSLNIPWTIWSSWSPHLLRIRGHWREPRRQTATEPCLCFLSSSWRLWVGKNRLKWNDMYKMSYNMSHDLHFEVWGCFANTTFTGYRVEIWLIMASIDFENIPGKVLESHQFFIITIHRTKLCSALPWAPGISNRSAAVVEAEKNISAAWGQ